VFKVTSLGVLTTLHTFTGLEGAIPYAGMILDSEGKKFYGTASRGGTSTFCQAPLGCGTVFTVTPSGQLTTIYSLPGGPQSSLKERVVATRSREGAVPRGSLSDCLVRTNSDFQSKSGMDFPHVWKSPGADQRDPSDSQ
jgi:uncharacterized repeat protein (TIGR03803 family)